MPSARWTSKMVGTSCWNPVSESGRVTNSLSSARTTLSFIEAPFATKVEYDAWRRLPPDEQLACLETARAKRAA